MLLGLLTVLLLIWVSALSYVLFHQKSRYNKLTQQGKQEQLQQLLESIVETQETLRRKTAQLEQDTQELAKSGQLHMQSIGVFRFNPFSDTGGAQSFSVAILDKEQNGLVMTALYGRNANRWFVKEVRKGAGIEVDLSKEEKEAIKRARHE